MSKGGVILYRCRYCGKDDGSIHVPDVQLAVVLATSGRRFPTEWGGASYGITSSHCCGSGRYGVSDLIGGVEDRGE